MAEQQAAQQAAEEMDAALRTTFRFDISYFGRHFTILDAAGHPAI